MTWERHGNGTGESGGMAAPDRKCVARQRLARSRLKKFKQLHPDGVIFGFAGLKIMRNVTSPDCAILLG
jgi:hypothetical protein